MANEITLKELQDASKDAKSLEEVVNGSDGKQVTTRLGETYPSVKKAMKTLFENGGLPATPFTTKALMTASALVDGDYAMVTDDAVTDNNGLYLKAAGVWVKSAYDPVLSANILDSLQNILNAEYAVEDSILDGATFTDGFYLDDGGVPRELSVYKYSDFVPVVAGTTYLISYARALVGVWYDSSKNLLAPIASGDAIDGTINHKVTAPTGAAFARLNISSLDTKEGMSAVTGKLIIPSQTANNATPMSNWKDKNIAWYGTSIPAGHPNHTTTALQDVWSHANLAVHDLGASIINKCVSSSSVTNGAPLPFSQLTSAVNYQNSLIDLIGTANEPDLVVFDFGVNDYHNTPSSIDNYDPLDPLDSANTGTKIRIDTRDVNTFIGAYNTIIDAMLTAKPDIKFCLITHFSDDSANSSFATYNYYAKLNIVIEAIADYWNTPVLKLHKRTNYRRRYGFDSMTPVIPDTIHPASGDGSSVQSLRAIMRDFLVSIG